MLLHHPLFQSCPHSPTPPGLELEPRLPLQAQPQPLLRRLVVGEGGGVAQLAVHVVAPRGAAQRGRRGSPVLVARLLHGAAERRTSFVGMCAPAGVCGAFMSVGYVFGRRAAGMRRA